MLLANSNAPRRYEIITVHHRLEDIINIIFPVGTTDRRLFLSQTRSLYLHSWIHFSFCCLCHISSSINTRLCFWKFFIPPSDVLSVIDIHWERYYILFQTSIHHHIYLSFQSGQSRERVMLPTNKSKTTTTQTLQVYCQWHNTEVAEVIKYQ